LEKERERENKKEKETKTTMVATIFNKNKLVTNKKRKQLDYHLRV
jgi:hypothetical protein